MSWQMLRWILLMAGLAVCFGLLLGTSWALQASQPRLRRQAHERRRLNEEWAALHAARQYQGRCPYCALPLTESHGHPGQALAEDEDQPDDD